MTPRFDWTPASKPPDTERAVLVWRRNGAPAFAQFTYGYWAVIPYPWAVTDITHWRDVEPPKAAE